MMNQSQASPSPPPVRPSRAADVRPAGQAGWGVRLLILVLVPLLAVTLLEGGLRLAGFGTAATYFVPAGDRGALTSNPAFGLGLVPPQVTARSPAIWFTGDKPVGTVRIFVLGGSAAMGYPEPDLSFGRILEVMLASSFPEAEFEVINAARPGINSHLLPRIAAECVDHHADYLLLYLGHDEVVGPFGPASEAAPFTAERWSIPRSRSIRQ